MKPFTPCLNAAGRKIKELKKGYGRKLTKSGTPNKFCYDFFELMPYIRSNTAHSIYKLDGDIPETTMSGESSNIRQFCEFEWFEWGMFQDKWHHIPTTILNWVDIWAQALILVLP